MDKWQVLESELILNKQWAKVRRDKCQVPGGPPIDYYYWEGGDFSQVFALTPDDQVVLVRQYKHAVKEIVIELPAGLIEPKDADPLACAKRELQEETGFYSDEWSQLGVLNVSSAKATTRAYLFLALNARRVLTPSPDKTEDIEVLLSPLPQVLNLISSGAIHDSNSTATTFLAIRHIKKPKET